MWYWYFIAWFVGFVMGGIIIVHIFFKMEEKELREKINKEEQPIEINDKTKYYTKEELTEAKEELLYDDEDYIKELLEEEE